MVVPISGYELSYCKASEKLEECDGEIKNITIKGDKSMGEYNIENLDFQSRYLIWVKTESHFAIQQRSNVTEYRNACKGNKFICSMLVNYEIIVFSFR